MSANGKLTAARLWIVIARCQRALALAIERSIAELGLCTSDFMVLEALLHKGPLTITEIQAKVLLASGSMTAAVDRVESKGLVVRKTTAKDRRARVLELTPEGRRLIEDAYSQHAEHLEKLMSSLNEGEKKQVYVLMKKLGQSLAATLGRPDAEREREQ